MATLRSLEKALRRERDFPNVKTQAWSRFALLVAERKVDHLYHKTLQVLEENPLRSHSFPVDVFRWHAAFALIDVTFSTPTPVISIYCQVSFGHCEFIKPATNDNS